MERADLIFIPYNYLVDPQTRSNQNLNIAKAIVILDEAHNLVGAGNSDRACRNPFEHASTWACRRAFAPMPTPLI